MSANDRVRVIRILSYEGPREWVEATVAVAIHGTKHLDRVRGGGEASITAVTLGEFPEILEKGEAEPKWVQSTIYTCEICNLLLWRRGDDATGWHCRTRGCPSYGDIVWRSME